MKILNCIQMGCGRAVTGNAGKMVVLQTKMKAIRKLFAVIAVASMLASCSKDVIHGSGNTKTSERTVANFSGVDVSGINKVYISYGPEISVALKGYSNLIPHYVTDVSNGTLHLHYENNTNVQNDNLEVYITMPSFNALSLSGSSAINATGDFEGTDELSIFTSGNGNINIEQINVDRYTINSSGNSDIATLGVKAKTAKAEISGSSTVSLSVTGNLEVHISGNGKVSYKGDPEKISSDISGNGEVIKL